MSIFGNKILFPVFIAVLLAQIYKVLISSITSRTFSFSMLFSTGGMPSSHSSAVASLITAISMTEADGIRSPLFAISLVFGLIVMYDAAGIRKEAGTQAAALNKVIDVLYVKEGEKIIEDNLKELLGHTPIQVLAGAIFGFLVSAILLYGDKN